MDDGRMAMVDFDFDAVDRSSEVHAGLVRELDADEPRKARQDSDSGSTRSTRGYLTANEWSTLGRRIASDSVGSQKLEVVGMRQAMQTRRHAGQTEFLRSAVRTNTRTWRGNRQ